MSTLTLKKFVLAFLVGVGSYAIPRILDALDAVNATGNYHVGRSVVISFLAGVIGAGVRMLLTLTPFEPTKQDRIAHDAQ